MLTTRRDILLGAGAAAVAQTLPGCSERSATQGSATDAQAQQRLSAVVEALLREYPENATALGLDKDGRDGLKRQLTDRSLAGYRQRGANAAQRLAELRTVDRNALSLGARTDVATVETAHEIAVDGFRFPYGDVVTLNQQWSYRNAPYVVAQNTGAFVELPDFLDSSHKVETGADADAYLSRLDGYSAALDGETERLRHDASIGVVAPAFLLDKTLKQMTGARAAPLSEMGLVTSIARRTEKIGGKYGQGAERIVTDKVLPALDRQIAELTRHRARATNDAGVWKLPQGDAYYAWALRAGTTTRMTPDEVHRTGLAELKTLHGKMDAILRAEGLTKGSVGERMTALVKDPRYLFPNDDAGRAQILAYVADRIADVRARLPRAFATLVPGKLVVKRVPVEIEAGAPGAYASAGTIDGTVPGNYYINLRDTSIWPRFALPTVTYHEGIPGHIWQGEYGYKLPLIRSLLAFNSYSEGWALYGEQLSDELGVYENDPLGRLGYLQAQAFRACRLVVDTGLHAKRWTRDQAIQWFATTNGSPVEEVSSEVDRYCAWPGQACGYKIGHTEINRLRDKARAALGARFDFRLFNDAVVKTGSVPLTVLEQAIEAYVAERRA